uniref:DNA polymerase beta domain protein region n=1 Tax=Rhodopseudomonas palustris (strain DX-1) TaxID=652103 RepID=E6VIW3_RHOPX
MESKVPANGEDFVSSLGSQRKLGPLSLWSRTHAPRVQVCYTEVMDHRTALAILRNSEAPLRARGVRRAALFGSMARGTNLPDSDIDVLVEIDPAAHITVFDYAELRDYIAGLFDHPVDVVNRDQLKPWVAPSATADAIYAF